MNDENIMSYALHLKQKGYVIVPERVIPLTKKEWDDLEYLTQEENLSYTSGLGGDTGEALSLRLFRIKKPGDHEIAHEELMEIVGSGKMLRFYQAITSNKKLFIDRAQVHIYKENDFIARHIDKESYDSYIYSLLIALSENFAGGEMVLYNEGDVHQLTIPYRSILFADSAMPHEVLPVRSGLRKTLPLFLME